MTIQKINQVCFHCNTIILTKLKNNKSNLKCIELLLSSMIACSCHSILCKLQSLKGKINILVYTIKSSKYMCSRIDNTSTRVSV